MRNVPSDLLLWSWAVRLPSGAGRRLPLWTDDKFGLFLDTNTLDFQIIHVLVSANEIAEHPPAALYALRGQLWAVESGRIFFLYLIELPSGTVTRGCNWNLYFRVPRVLVPVANFPPVIELGTVSRAIVLGSWLPRDSCSYSTNVKVACWFLLFTAEFMSILLLGSSIFYLL